MIKFEDVHKELGGQAVLDGLNLEIERGETMAIIGRSGSGKSVTLKHIVCLLFPDSGTVSVDGVATSSLGTRGVFERTPKRGGYRALARGLPGIELTLALWLGWAAVCAARAGLWGSLPFLALFTASFLWVGGLSLWEALAVQVGSSRRFAKAQSSRRSPGEGSRV